MLDKYANFLEERKKNNLYREISQHKATGVDFSTNDYLGFSKRREIGDAIVASLNLGVGATGARLFSGNKKILDDLEKQIAQDKSSETALIIASGFQTNLTVLSSLLEQSVLGHKPIVFFDRLNHSSLYQAIFLSKAELVRYKHLDLDHLEFLLKSYSSDSRSKFIVSETLFGMDGDVVDLDKLIKLARMHKVLLYLDEAHATGILGNNGYGLSTDFDLFGIEYVLMGTFSKAVGLFGGYIATSQLLRNYIINKAPGFIYSTAIPPCLCAGILEAWNLIKNTKDTRHALLRSAQYLREALRSIGCDTANSTSHIIPIALQQNESSVALRLRLQEVGYIISAVRPPTVPSERIRISICASHTEEEIEGLLQAIKTTLVEYR